MRLAKDHSLSSKPTTVTRFSLRFLLGLIAIAAIALWWMDSGYRVVYDEQEPRYGRFVVYAKRDASSGRYLTRVRFIPPNGDAKKGHLSEVMELQNPPRELGFESVVDNATKLWCIYDTSDEGFVILAYPHMPKSKQSGSFGSFWHPGIHIGWGRGFWSNFFLELKKANPKIPYEDLPAEMRIVYE